MSSLSEISCFLVTASIEPFSPAGLAQLARCSHAELAGRRLPSPQVLVVASGQFYRYRHGHAESCQNIFAACSRPPFADRMDIESASCVPRVGGSIPQRLPRQPVGVRALGLVICMPSQWSSISLFPIRSDTLPDWLLVTWDCPFIFWLRTIIFPSTGIAPRSRRRNPMKNRHRLSLRISFSKLPSTHGLF